MSSSSSSTKVGNKTTSAIDDAKAGETATIVPNTNTNTNTNTNKNKNTTTTTTTTTSGCNDSEKNARSRSRSGVERQSTSGETAASLSPIKKRALSIETGNAIAAVAAAAAAAALSKDNENIMKHTDTNANANANANTNAASSKENPEKRPPLLSGGATDATASSSMSTEHSNKEHAQQQSSNIVISCSCSCSCSSSSRSTNKSSPMSSNSGGKSLPLPLPQQKRTAVPSASASASASLKSSSSTASNQTDNRHHKTSRKNSKTVWDPAALLIESHPVYANVKKELVETISFFTKNKMKSLQQLYFTEIPPEFLDSHWEQPPQLHKFFPPQRRDGKPLGARHVPKCLMMDAKYPEAKLVVVNWWRGLTGTQQGDASQELKLFYRVPTRSNSPFTLRMLGVQGGREEAVAAKKEKGPISFRTIFTCKELSERLETPINALYCVQLTNEEKSCVIEGCPYPCVHHNRYHCVLHRRSWYPTNELLAQVVRRRGHYLLGVEYLVSQSRKQCQCACSNTTCEGIGWARPDDLYKTPKDFEDVHNILHPDFSKEVDFRPRLAPWHFAPQHRVQRPDGTWKINFDKRTGPFPPAPTYDPKEFLNEPGMMAYKARLSSMLLPAWVHAYRTKEEGPMTIGDYQTRQLLDENLRLIEQLQQQMNDQETLEKERQQLEERLVQIKSTHVRRRKRRSKKKKNKNKNTANNKRARTDNGSCSNTNEANREGHSSESEDNEEEEETYNSAREKDQTIALAHELTQMSQAQHLQQQQQHHHHHHDHDQSQPVFYRFNDGARRDITPWAPGFNYGFR